METLAINLIFYDVLFWKLWQSILLPTYAYWRVTDDAFLGRAYLSFVCRSAKIDQSQ